MEFLSVYVMVLCIPEIEKTEVNLRLFL
jgi:hypothetical protein